ncbi:hypothetical protein ABTW76_05510 [Paenibacillus dendritiformis]
MYFDEAAIKVIEQHFDEKLEEGRVVIFNRENKPIALITLSANIAAPYGYVVTYRQNDEIMTFVYPKISMCITKLRQRYTNSLIPSDKGDITAETLVNI